MISSAESRYNQWVRDHYRFLLRSAWALTGSRAVAEDVVQDCFTSAWRFRNQLRDQNMARAWLFQIMRRHAFRHFDPLRGSFESVEELGEHPPSQPDALDRQLDVVKALARIAPIHREVLVLYYFDDMPTAQMAEALEICYDAVAEPKILVMCGTEACSGGLFAESRALDRSFLDSHTPDLWLPGAPTHPMIYIDGLLTLLGRKKRL